MTQVSAKNLRSRLRLAASALVVAAAAMSAAHAGSTDYTVASGGTYGSWWVSDGNYVINSGVAAEYWNYTAATWQTYPAYTGSAVILGQSTWVNSADGAATIEVMSGGTLYIENYYWGVLGNMVTAHAGSTVQIDPYGETIFLYTNTLEGNVNLSSGTTLSFGQTWSAGSSVFADTTNFYLGSGSTVNFYQANSNEVGTFASADATAVVKLAGGTIIVNGSNTASSAYLGTVNVTKGTLMIGDSTHTGVVFGDPTASSTVINVSSAGILAGYGTIYGTVNNDDIVKAGGESGTLGTLNVVGSYNQTSNGRLYVEIMADGTSSSLAVDGTATFTGGTINVTIDSGDYNNAIYQVLSATSVVGADTVSVSTSGCTTCAIVGTTSDDEGVYVVTEKGASAQTIGHLAAANRTSLYGFTRSLYDVIELGTPPAGAKVASAKGEFSVWATPFGSLDNVSRDGTGYNNKSVGVSGGVEFRMASHNAVVGIAGSYASGWMDVKHQDMSASSSTMNVALYGGADVQNARIDGVVFYNVYDATAKRDLDTYGVASSKPKGWAWGGSVQVSRSLFGDLVTPYARGIFAKIHQDGVDETGASYLNLGYDAIDENTLVADAGLRVHLLKPTPELKAKLEATIAIQHDFSDPGEVVTGDLLGSTFAYTWDGNSANALLVGLNFADEVVAGVEVFGRVNGTFTTQQRAVDFQVGAKYRF